jgi:predicted RNA-binding Zn-ribbon protein involved in translation (DUF1610 family)
VSGAWEDYRRRRRRLAWVILAGLAALALSFLPARARHSARPVLAGFVLLLGGTLWASSSLADFPCPHCGKPFSRTEEGRDAFTKVCVHCGRAKWS